MDPNSSDMTYTLNAFGLRVTIQKEPMEKGVVDIETQVDVTPPTYTFGCAHGPYNIDHSCVNCLRKEYIMPYICKKCCDAGVDVRVTRNVHGIGIYSTCCICFNTFTGLVTSDGTVFVSYDYLNHLPGIFFGPVLEELTIRCMSR
jgi:hypothetical protein